jgi:endoglycosylceramidase
VFWFWTARALWTAARNGCTFPTMRWLVAAVTSVLLTANPFFTTPTPVKTPEAISHSGRWLTDSSGRVVIVHGFNLVAKTPPYEPAATGFGDDDAAFLAAHGFNVVRLGVIFAGLEPTPGHFDARYLASIDGTVRTLARHGIYSLLDFHQDMYNEKYQGEGLPSWMAEDNGLPAQPRLGFPADQVAMPALNRAYDNFWANSPGPDGKGLQDWYTEGLAHVAAHFRADSGVLGYDIFNEPWPGSAWPSCLPPFGCHGFDGGALASFTRRATKAIHAVDPRHLVFYEPDSLANEAAPTFIGSPGDSRSGESFHVYCAATVGIPESPPVRAVCNGLEGATVNNALHQSAKTGDALMLTEFGATTDLSELSSVVGPADRDRLPWMEWAYCACHDPTGSGEAEAVVHDPAKPPTGANVDDATLAALEEPYPQSVAGVPVSYGYSGGVFTLGYTVPHHISAPTVVYVPPADFPAGYRVTVTGARVVSAAGASSLKLVTLPKATAVSVRVSRL